uniref:ZP domain-containing protein n=1 Tax=Ditylenchus dipsaci TaxID=166011 RepID=A0A915CPR0_9BILA
MRGKARVICEETGIEFGINTIFPFTGQIFAHDRKRIPNCVHAFNKAWNINVSFSYSECGIKNTGNESSQQAQFHLQIIVMFEQADKSTSIQSFIAQCGQQKVNYNKQTIPKRIEEALEELKLVPTQLEQKAPIPEAQMHVVTDVEHHKPGDGTEVIEVNVGQPLRVEFSLQPESDAYGFHVRNCVVKDMVSGAEHQVIDDKGCSTDLNIFAHPHYDTYHDVARVHWHAFKLPDHTQLSVRCHIEICTEINDESGMNSCAAIPTPPFCPDLITSPSNSILSDANGNLVRRRYVKRQTENLEAMVQAVHADICFGKNKTSASRNKRDYCDTEQFNKDRQNHLERLVEEDYDSATKICASRIWINLITSFCAGVLALAALLNLCAVILGRRRGNWSTNSKQQHITTQPKLENHAKEFRFVGAALPVTSFK